jgi:phytoene dehydrogenase-like protein
LENRHEAGGGWCTDEGAAPGFLADYHASGVASTYHLTLERDFPEWKELGGRYSKSKVTSSSAIFKEDNDCLVIYTSRFDPTQEHTAKEIARFSEKDAETWLRLLPKVRRVAMPLLLEWWYNPPPPPGEPDALERLSMNPELGFDPAQAAKSTQEVLQDVFESNELVALAMRFAQSFAIPPTWPGIGIYGFLVAFMGLTREAVHVTGGTHQWAHAATKILAANGAKVFTKNAVDKVLIENGRTKGVRLADGTEIEAKKLVVSTVSPEMLCCQLVGEEYFSPEIIRKVKNLERRFTCITWYTWAVHEVPKYRAASINPDIDKADGIFLVSKDPRALEREWALRLLGKMPDELLLSIQAHTLVDPTRAPEGKHSLLTEQFVLPANALTEKEWMEYKKSHAEATIETWQKVAPNMTWDNVIGYIPLTPYDHCKLPNMAPYGNYGIIDASASQLGRFRPIPELSGYKTPVKNLYATGSGWHPICGGMSYNAYNCYKVIAQDLGLKKPWEETESPW